MLRFGLSVIALLATLTPARGQDSNYWTHHFGNRARLLGGSIIGSVEDISAVYYNPGALSLIEGPEVLIAGRVFEFTSFTIKDPNLKEVRITQTRPRLVPSLFGGSHRINSTNRLAYSILTRYDSRFRLRSNNPNLNFNLGIPGLETQTNNFFLQQDLYEYWVGVTWSREINDTTGLGISTFLVTRGKQSKLQNTSQFLNNDGNSALAYLNDDYNYWHWRILWKVGLAKRVGAWRVGLNATTPSLAIYGKGDRAYDKSVVSKIPGNEIDQINSDYQEVDAKYRSGFATGFGVSRQFRETKLHFSGEWYAPVSRYKILDTKPFKGQSTGEIIETALVQELRGVFNVAVGIEHQLSKKYYIYGSFHTDFNAKERSGDKNNSSIQDFDIYHFSGGSTIRFGRTDLTLGATYAFSRPKAFPTNSSGLLPEELQFSYQRFGLIVGFEF